MDDGAERILDVGCGTMKYPGAVGIDQFDLDGVDVVHDLNARPWPFEEGAFDRVVCRHSLSHFSDFVATVEEIHRVLKDGGILEVWGPHFTSDNFFTDPTMVTPLAYRTFDYFATNPFAWSFHSSGQFVIERRSLTFRNHAVPGVIEAKPNPFRWVGLEALVNRFPRIYERFFAFTLPVAEVHFRLRAVKPE